MPVITAALFARFASRQDESFAAKVNAALRNEFGGHARRRSRMTARTADENPLLEGLQLRRTPGAVRPRDLRRLGRPDAAQADAGALLARVPAAAAGAVRGRRRRAQRGDRRRVPRADEGGGAASTRATRSARTSGSGSPTGCATLDSTSPTTTGEDRLAQLLTELDEERGTQGNRVYYFAVPPSAIATLVEEIGERRSAEGWTRLDHREAVRPRPRVRAGAERAARSEHFAEDEVFRIDHYLGKETVQNMLALRFANGIFEPIWNRQFIDHVQITVAESIGIEGRAGYYEQAGAIRDIFQNHLLQLVALTAMEPPIDFTRRLGAQREGEGAARRCTRPGRSRSCAASTGRGFVEGEEVPGYREEEGVAPDSMTETFVAAKLYVDNWRWADTPFYVRMGKRLAAARDDDRDPVQARAAPAVRGGGDGGAAPERARSIHVQPDEGVSLAIGAKVPGQGMTIRTVHMDFLYGGAFREGLPEAYERLILDAMLGDATLFTRADEVEEQWALVDAIVAAWQRDRPAFPNYAAGTWGPGERRRAARTGTAARGGTPLSDWTGERRSPRSSASSRGCATRRRRGEPRPNLRTSVMTHIAWVPPEWLEAAERDARGHGGAAPVAHDPARPAARRATTGSTRTRSRAAASRSATGRSAREVIELRLRGERAQASGELVCRSRSRDLPVFCRWRGRPAVRRASSSSSSASPTG